MCNTLETTRYEEEKSEENLSLLEQLRDRVELCADRLHVVLLCEQLDHLLSALETRHDTMHERIERALECSSERAARLRVLRVRPRAYRVLCTRTCSSLCVTCAPVSSLCTRRRIFSGS